MKDLRIIKGSELRDMLIVDNSPSCFLNFINNGIPILPYKSVFEDDVELQKLTDYLTWLYDHRPTMVLKNSEYFKLHIGLRYIDKAKAFPEMFRC